VRSNIELTGPAVRCQIGWKPRSHGTYGGVTIAVRKNVRSAEWARGTALRSYLPCSSPESRPIEDCEHHCARRFYPRGRLRSVPKDLSQVIEGSANRGGLGMRQFNCSGIRRKTFSECTPTGKLPTAARAFYVLLSREWHVVKGVNLSHLEVYMGGGEPHERKSWQELAAQAATETDSSKLMELVTELCDEFERGENKRRRGTTTEDRV